jgi:hypothetical protein
MTQRLWTVALIVSLAIVAWLLIGGLALFLISPGS